MAKKEKICHKSKVILRYLSPSSGRRRRQVVFKKLSGSQEEAMKILFELFSPKIFQIAYYILQDRPSAEDVVQDTFLAAMEHLDRLKNPEKIAGWLLRIAANKACKEYRRRQRFLDPMKRLAGACTDTDEEMITNRLDVYKALGNLPYENQIVIFLKYYYELTTKQIAELLSIPEGTVKSRLQKARSLVENLLCVPVEGVLNERLPQRRSRRCLKGLRAAQNAGWGTARRG